MKKIGFIINPIAGLGGRVGLKGSDGNEIVKKAIELGAHPESSKRAYAALRELVHIKDTFIIITCPQEMGEQVAVNLGFTPVVIGKIKSGNTTPADTERLAQEMLIKNIELLLFAGGDGTARNIYNAVADKVTVLGIPAGVKIHSAVFATSPANAGKLASMYIKNSNSRVSVKEAEVMDIDEQAFREDKVTAKLYGYMKIPYEESFVQGAKIGSSPSEEAATIEIAHEIVNNMEKNCLYIIGPGTSTRCIMDVLKLPYTLLGVDAVYNKKLVATDLNEKGLLKLIKGKKTKLVITVIGGQGYIFGRGNQQISPSIIQKVGIDNIIVVATKSKLVSLNVNPLRVDTGDDKVNKALCGYIKVVTGLKERVLMKVEC
jgi:predicted polyphosphate/ATP-dependent NAD kinase